MFLRRPLDASTSKSSSWSVSLQADEPKYLSHVRSSVFQEAAHHAWKRGRLIKTRLSSKTCLNRGGRWEPLASRDRRMLQAAGPLDLLSLSLSPHMDHGPPGLTWTRPTDRTQQRGSPGVRRPQTTQQGGPRAAPRCPT